MQTQTCSESVANPAETLGEGMLVEQKRPGLVTRQSRFEEDTRFMGTTSSATLPPESRVQRQKSVSRRMLSKVKQGISGRSKNSPPIRHMESETSLIRKISGRRKQSDNVDRHSQSFEVVRPSIETPDFVSFTSAAGQRSFTDSTVSTAEVLGDSPDALAPKFVEPILDGNALPGLAQTSSLSSQPPTSPSPQPTPRPPPRKELPPLLRHADHDISLAVPCVDLYVVMDAASVDVHSKRDIWVAVEATVRSMSTKINSSNASTATSYSSNHVVSSTTVSKPDEFAEPHSLPLGASEPTCGAITTLRLCFKPVQGCLLREVIGQKSVKDLTIGQQCSLFIRLRVPKIRVRDSTIDSDQASLFTELESIVGTLKTEILHVEARYRHSMLPMDNVVTVRHVCKIKRPKTESRWSIMGHTDELGAPAEVHSMLARYVAAHYPSGKALELLGQYLAPASLAQPGVRSIYESLQIDLQNQQTSSPSDNKPSVIVTDIDLDTVQTYRPQDEHFEFAPNTSSHHEEGRSYLLGTSALSNIHVLGTKTQQHPALPKYAPPLLTAPKTTTALSTDTSSSTDMNAAENHESLESQDTARQLWRHIRRTSLSTKQLEEMASNQLNQFEPDDEHLRELHRRALVNKRSIGAETLRAWKWEESMQNREKPGEAPWM